MKPYPGLLVWMRLVRVFHRIQRHEIKFLQQYRLSLAQFDVLAQLLNHEGSTQQELADWLMVTKGGLCTLLDRMVARGWVERCPDPHNRRINRVYLTSAGKDLAQQVLPAHDRQIAALVQQLGADDVDMLLTLLRRLDHKLDV